MKKLIFYIATVAVSLGNFVSAQNSVEIFADVKSNDSLQKFVTILADELKKSSPFNFIVQPSSTYKGKGIYLNTALSSQKVKPSTQLLKAGIEAFSIDATDQTVQILGNCNMAIGHGIFSYLESLGYRYYFANPDWHIVPSKPVLFRKWKVISAPSFNSRRMLYGYGTGSKIADADYNFWVLANKIGGSMNPSFGHSYETIAWRNKDEFFKHPEWFYPPAPKNTIPSEGKFDMTHEDLIQLVIADVEKQIELSLKNKTNDYKMITLAPSDGTGTCNTPACQQLGTMTDRVYYLTNKVAKAIQKKYPSTLIGCLAYSEYIAPPTKKIEPNVFVGITTAFNYSKYSTEQLVDEWRKKGAIIGIYDYFSWYAWDFDVPGISLASRQGQLIKNLKKYYAKGVRAYEGESSIGWVSKGLGYYLAAKQMWDINADPAFAKKEFFSLCFNKAADVMEKLWNEWENNSFTIVRENDLAKWIEYVAEAERKEQSENVRKRLLQVKSYLHYLFLYNSYSMAKTEGNLLSLLNFGYRKLDDGSLGGYPAFFVLGGGSGIAGMGYEDKAKWKNNNRPVTPEELNQLIKGDRSKLKLLEPVKEFFPAKKFSPVPNLNRYAQLFADSNNISNTYWYTNEWVIEIKNKGAANYIDFTGDLIGNPSVTKPIKISIYPFTQDGDVSSQTPLIYYEYRSSKIKERVNMSQLKPGYYTMIIEDPVKTFQFSFSPSINHSMVMRSTRPIRSTALTYSFIYVPEGVKKFNITKNNLLEIITPTGRKISHMDGKAEEIQIEVKEGETGLWRIKPTYDQLFIEGIPPYLSTSATHMLIPGGIK